MKKIFAKKSTKIIAIVILAFLIAAFVEIFIPTGFRFGYLQQQNYPENQELVFHVEDFALTSSSIEGESVKTDAPGGFLELDGLNMPVTYVIVDFSQPVEKKTRFVVTYTTEQNQSYSIPYYVYAGETSVKIELVNTGVPVSNIKIALSDEAGQAFDIDQVAFEYLRPLDLCKEKFSFVRLLLFWAILALIPIELMNINKL